MRRREYVLYMPMSVCVFCTGAGESTVWLFIFRGLSLIYSNYIRRARDDFIFRACIGERALEDYTMRTHVLYAAVGRCADECARININQTRNKCVIGFSVVAVVVVVGCGKVFVWHRQRFRLPKTLPFGHLAKRNLMSQPTNGQKD